MKKLFCAIMFGLIWLGGSAGATTYTVDWSTGSLDLDGVVQTFSGSFTVEHDFSVNAPWQPGTTVGLLSYTLSFTTIQTVGYGYDANVDQFIYIFMRGTGTGAFDTTSIGNVSVSPSPVPLPASMPLLFVGLAGLGWIGRRKAA